MARTNKKTRIKGLPPKLQLQQKDAATGSFPSNVRIASDNRTGNYTVQYDDMNTIVFGETNDLIKHVISYYSFNSGAAPFGQVTQTLSGPPSASFTITPTYINPASGNIDQNKFTLELTSNDPPTFAHFDTQVPFSGPPDDPNLTSLCFLPTDNVSVSGSMLAFNPATEVAVSGSPEKPFSIAFWMSEFGSPTVMNMFAVATDSAVSAPLGITTGSILNVELRTGNSINMTIIDANNNGIGRSWPSAVPGSTWSHIVLTYDGQKTFDSFKLYVNGVDKGAGGGLFQGTLGAYSGMSGSIGDYKLFWGGLKGTLITRYDGLLDEFIFFDKVLSAGDALALSRYDKTITIMTGNLNPFGGMYYGIGARTNSPYLTEPFEQTSSLRGDGVVRKGIGDAIASFTPGQDLKPFRDSNNPAVDGKSSGDPFYATGSKPSEAGEGFDQPLWSKTKIEIPLPVRFAGGQGPPGTASFQEFQTYVSAAQPTAGGFVGIATELNYPMMYYNFDVGTWEGLGLGIPYSHITRSFNQGIGSFFDPYKDHFMAGFAPSPVMISPESANDPSVWRGVISGVFEWQASAGTPMSNFGFPFHPKFHATSSQLLDMSTYIDRPFLVEKIYVQISASFVYEPETYTTSSFSGLTNEAITNITESIIPAAVNNFFIMNQVRPAKFSTIQRQELTIFSPSNPLNDVLVIANVPTRSFLSNTTNKTYVDTTRELIACGGVTSFAANMPPSNSLRAGSSTLFSNATPEIQDPTALLTRDANFTSTASAINNLEPLSWEGMITMELQARSPIRIDRNSTTQDNVFSIYGAQGTDEFDVTYADAKFSNGGRNGLGLTVPSGRDLRSPVAEVAPITDFLNLFSAGKENVLLLPNQHAIVNPYLLQPTDKLIIGWQQPIPMFSYPTGSTSDNDQTRNVFDDRVVTRMRFFHHPDNKIILYGSEIRENKEFHDTLNQLLTSDTVHEVIE